MVVTQAWPAKLRPSRPPSARPADGARLADATDRLRRRLVQIRRAEGNRGSQKEPQVKATIATRVWSANSLVRRFSATVGLLEPPQSPHPSPGVQLTAAE